MGQNTMPELPQTVDHERLAGMTLDEIDGMAEDSRRAWEVVYYHEAVRRFEKKIAPVLKSLHLHLNDGDSLGGVHTRSLMEFIFVPDVNHSKFKEDRKWFNSRITELKMMYAEPDYQISLGGERGEFDDDIGFVDANKNFWICFILNKNDQRFLGPQKTAPSRTQSRERQGKKTRGSVKAALKGKRKK